MMEGSFVVVEARRAGIKGWRGQNERREMGVRRENGDERIRGAGENRNRVNKTIF
jgi:hypothetical protein